MEKFNRILSFGALGLIAVRVIKILTEKKSLNLDAGSFIKEAKINHPEMYK